MPSAFDVGRLVLDIVIEANKLNKLKEKFEKYPPFAIRAGLDAMNREMNTDSFKRGMYPPDRNGQPFMWSSPRQRRYVFANVALPHIRTFRLADSGRFSVDERYFTIEYSNSQRSWIFVIHPQHQIIGHKTRNWPTVNRYVVNRSGALVRLFKPAAIQAWDDMDSLVFGGSPGL